MNYDDHHQFNQKWHFSDFFIISLGFDDFQYFSSDEVDPKERLFG